MDETLQRALRLIDEENSKDPTRDIVEGQSVPRELLYSRRLTEWVERLEPNASIALRIAARSQHIARWRIPRSDYPEGRAGYHQWRSRLKQFHADLTSDLLRTANCEEGLISRVRSLNLKQSAAGDLESQTLEDALCLVFLEHQLGELSDRLERDKVINALRKSWAKMSPRAREAAMNLPFSTREKALLSEALGPGAQGST